MSLLLAQSADDQLLRWGWIADHVDDILDRTLQHLWFTGVSVLLGFAVSVVLALVALRYRRLQAPIIGLGGVLYTVPSLAAFALLFPFFGLARTTAIIPLATYTILILVRNIVAGIDGVPAEVREAAVGMGYGRLRLLLRIEVPLALPVIFAGLRVATVTVVGLVTVTALLGFGGLGFFILDALRRFPFFVTEAVVGTVGSLVLAVLLDGAILGVQRLLTPWSRRAAAA